MKFDYILLRQISVLSAFFGAIAGIITIIPFIGTYSFIFLLCFIAPVVIWLLYKYNCISINSIKDGIIIGAISGFVAYLAFSVIYIPISIILLKLLKFAANQGIGLMLNNAGFFILTVTSIFLGVVGATINAFTGFITFYVIEFFNSIKK
ncbi:hypothetical protein J6N69_06640 [bacterium]|nr:hypothetical protein [bacterium]